MSSIESLKSGGRGIGKRMSFLKNLQSPERIYEIRESGIFAQALETVKEKYETLTRSEMPHITYSKYYQTYKDGNRRRFELDYFAVRERLSTSAVMAYLYPECEEYLTVLVDTMWAICGEYTWALPAHVPEEAEDKATHIDLFAAETGFYLAEITALLGKRIPADVADRVHSEIKRRIIEPFIAEKFIWEERDTNWAAVCGGSVACTFMYEAPERYEVIKSRIDHAMESFLGGFKADGVCREGVAYWVYGFGYYSIYADMMCKFSEGKINPFDNEKVRKIAKSAKDMFLYDGVAVSFSDASINSALSACVTSILNTHYGDEITVSKKDAVYSEKWSYMIRFFEFYRGTGETGRTGATYFENAEWYIDRRENYVFAAKAGNNAEPHNHNDIGSFIFAADGKQIFADLGAGEYTVDYFMPDRRYEIINCRSMWHNVPIVNGCEQKYGGEYWGNMELFADGVKMDMTNAYADCGLKKLERSCNLSDNGLTVCDSFELEGGDNEVRECLISFEEPSVCGNAVTVSGVRASCAEAAEVNVVKDVVAEHDSTRTDIYRTEFICRGIGGKKDITINIEIG